MNDVDAKLRRLARALRRLEATGDQGDRARRNARAEVRNALYAVRRLVDAALVQFPAPKVLRVATARRSPREVIAALTKDGWDDLTHSAYRVQRLAELAHRGIRVRRVVLKEMGGTIEKYHLFAPPWTKDVPVAKLDAARRSALVRNATKAVTKLTAAPPSGTP